MRRQKRERIRLGEVAGWSQLACVMTAMGGKRTFQKDKGCWATSGHSLQKRFGGTTNAPCPKNSVGGPGNIPKSRV
jgi:hypothetical protein